MADYSESEKQNPNLKTIITLKQKNSKQQKQKNKGEYEFCKVCKLNQDQGQRHKYLPNHKKSLSAFLSRFQAKLSDIRFFLKNPTPLRAEFASHNRFWCVFCDIEVDEISSSFACDNAINHLASAVHLKNSKHFLWKYGGEMNQVATFRIEELDLVKWKKKCKSLKSLGVSSSGGSHGTVIGPSNDIHNEITYENIDNSENSSIHSLKPGVSNGVMPLLYGTNEYQVSHPGVSGVRNEDQFLRTVTPCLPVDACSVNRNTQNVLFAGNCDFSADGRMVNGQSSFNGLQNLTQVASFDFKASEGNVHSGAPPPWFTASDENELMHPAKAVSHSLSSSSSMPRKSQKLNPKRVGAAWAEKRKIELDMERRGEIVKNNFDADWLPNFGRVWQSGSRKESRKAFDLEKEKSTMVENQTEMPMKIQPYVSKRMK